MSVKNILKSKKFRYGSISVVFTAVILVLIIVINAVFSLLAAHYHWYVDTSAEKLYTLSDTSKELLNELFEPGENGEPVFSGVFRMVFLQDKDRIEDSKTDEGKQLKQVHELALEYAGEYPDRISIDYIDMYTRPGALSAYRSKGAQLSPTSVVFDNGGGLFQAVALVKFFAFDEGDLTVPIGFYGEHRITSTILSMCGNRYTAYVTEGHGEDELSSAFTMLLESCGFTLKSVNLLELAQSDFRQMLGEDLPRLVVINNPKSEFVGLGKNGVSELIRLSEILSGKYTDSSNPSFASLLLLADPSSNCASANLNSLLKEWGQTLRVRGVDTVKETQQNALDSKLTAFFPEYDTEGLVSSLTSRLRVADNYKAIVNGAGVIELSDVSASSSFNGSVLNGAVLRCSDGAVNESGNASGAAVFAISQRINVVDSTITKYNYVIVSSDCDIVSEKYLNTASYANEALMTSVMRMTTNDRDATPKAQLIEYKDYIEETNVQGVSNGGKQTFLISMAVILPLLILTVGIVVYVRRRNRV